MITKRLFIKLLLGASFLLPVLIFSGCTKNKDQKVLDPLAARGKASYMSNCIACHNPNPTLAGSVGPDVDRASLELITARVMHMAYPPGYKPKRNSMLMPAMPYLEGDLPALYAYLNTFKK